MPTGSARKMLILKVSGNIQTTVSMGSFMSCKDGGLVFFSVITFSWKTTLLKTYHSPSNSSLLIIAREEYVTPSNVTSAFFPQKLAKLTA